MGKVKQIERKRIIEAAGHYLCAENPDDLYAEYVKLLDASDDGNDDCLAADYAEVWEPLANHMTVAKLIETIENAVNIEMPEIYKGIDWEVLKQQKKVLLEMADNIDDVPKLEAIEGIISLLNEIQDDVVDNYGMDENLVFDLHPEDDCEKDDDGNCIYCGEKCWEGEMCDEQQAGGFND